MTRVARTLTLTLSRITGRGDKKAPLLAYRGEVIRRAMFSHGEYFDLQVNGYGGVDFNQDDLTVDDLHRACEKLRGDGVGGILATVITEHVDLMRARVTRLASSRNQDPLAQQIIHGIHIEGPFLNETTGYRGAHPADAIKPANLDDAQRLFDASQGLLKLMTLAPERDLNL